MGKIFVFLLLSLLVTRFFVGGTVASIPANPLLVAETDELFFEDESEFEEEELEDFEEI